MALPTQEAFNRPVLEVFAEAAEILAVKQIYDRLPLRMSLSEEDLAEKYPSGYEIFPIRVRVAISKLQKERSVKRVKYAHYQITSRGSGRVGVSQPTPPTVEETAPEPTEPPGVTEGSSEGTHDLQPDFRELDPGELMETVSERLAQDLNEEMQAKLRTMPWRSFEFLVLKVLEAVGYGQPEHTGGVGDGGIDGIVHQDLLGLERIYMQAKRWDEAVVGRPVVQKFDDDLTAKGATKGVLFTSSRFHADARRYAQEVKGKTIVLIDGQEMAQMMIDNGIGVTTEASYEVKRLNESYFADF